VIVINIFDFEDEVVDKPDEIDQKDELSDEEKLKIISRNSQLIKQVITIDGTIHSW
jgi:arsenate reductase-like glutaredoxin family protein